jgi:glutaminyl-tRNA synthetase
VRLRYAYLVTCTDVVKDDAGEVVEVRCTYDPETRGGNAPDGRRVKGTIHWVSAAHAVPAEVRLYDKLFLTENPAAADDFVTEMNPDSLEVRPTCWLEPDLANAQPGARLQLERLGYFCVDPDSTAGTPVLNRTATLRDTWAKMQKKGG